MLSKTNYSGIALFILISTTNVFSMNHQNMPEDIIEIGHAINNLNVEEIKDLVHNRENGLNTEESRYLQEVLDERTYTHCDMLGVQSVYLKSLAFSLIGGTGIFMKMMDKLSGTDNIFSKVYFMGT